MRKAITALVIMVFLLALMPMAPALAAPNTTVVFAIGSQNYTVNGQAQAMDAAPFIDQAGRTMVPVRFLAQSLGASVNWDPASQTVTLTAGSTTVDLTIGSTTETVNGQAESMDTAPMIVPPGRTELPARFVAQAFGYHVSWNASARTVTISDPPPAGPIGTVLFQPTLKNLTVTVGSTTATGTNLDGSTSTVSLPAAPVLVVPPGGPSWNPSDSYKQQAIANDPSVYNNQDVQVNSGSTGDIYVPVAAVFEAFGVPAANVQWDGSRLTIYLSPSEPIYLTPGSAVDTSQDGSQGHLQDPLLVIDGVPMLDYGTMKGFMFGFDKAPDHLLNGIQDGQVGPDMYNGTAEFAYYPMSS